MNEFYPDSLQKLFAQVSGDRDASFRMALGYWDMAATRRRQAARAAAQTRSASEVPPTVLKK